jgi:hypothetical protein
MLTLSGTRPAIIRSGKNRKKKKAIKLSAVLISIISHPKLSDEIYVSAFQDFFVEK